MLKSAMRIEEELAKVTPQKEMMLTIGVFDGVHLGHQHLLTCLRDKAKANDWISGVITFKSHPKELFSTNNKLAWLDDLENRINLIHELGINTVIVLSFTPELSQLSAREFMQLLRDYLKVRGLVIGPDFALGKSRQGDTEQLRLLGQEMDFSVEIVSPLILDGEAVSSSAIRQALTRGSMKKVAKLLGRNFSLTGQVVPGDKRGRILGFPTVNLDIKPEQASPSDGVYATIAHTDHDALPSVTNIGIRPTFGGEKHLVETYIIDYEGQLQEQSLKIEFVDRLRDEQHFKNTEELKAQIGRDVEQARTILNRITD